MPQTRDQKRQKVEALRAARALRTPQMQLELLDKKGFAAKKERARLAEQIKQAEEEAKRAAEEAKREAAKKKEVKK